MTSFGMSLGLAILLADIEPMNEVGWSSYLAEEMREQGLEVKDEFRLPDGTRIDIWEVKRNICWEVEWVKKSDAAFGQSARYAQITGGTAGVWLLMKPGDDEDFHRAMESLAYFESRGVNIPMRITRIKDGRTFEIRRLNK